LTRLEGNPNVVIAEPDITAFKITEQSKYDFIVIGCDGIFDKLDNKETIHLIW
jgi:serine/threonine protein phosphatase PrpC